MKKLILDTNLVKIADTGTNYQVYMSCFLKQKPPRDLENLKKALRAAADMIDYYQKQEPEEIDHA